MAAYEFLHFISYTTAEAKKIEYDYADYDYQGKRFQMEEVAVYKVADGQIVYEEFYNM